MQTYSMQNHSLSKESKQNVELSAVHSCTC